MPTYLAASLQQLEFSTDGGTTWVDVNLFDAGEFSINKPPVNQGVQQGKQVTAKKTTEVSATLFDRDSAVLGALQTAEGAFTEVRWRVTFKTGNTEETKDAPISIEDATEESDGLLGYTVTSQYETGFGEEPTTITLT